ncbi:MAG: alpha-2-macroglobulin family protein, partial [Candidatus Thiodiazotropha sp.]
FKVTPDASRYVPGETARLVLESPFQNARALAILEGPDGNRYDWLQLRNGSATYELPVTKAYTPRVPVHFLLMRGRVGDKTPSGSLDLGKPATLAATAWIEVEPVENRLEVALEHRQKAQPGEELEVTVRLSDKAGRPLAGEVTLWLVDQAVLALGKEQRLELLPDFITAMPTHMLLRDTRNLALGYLPFEEQPGGGAQVGAAKSQLLEDNVTVRKNFQSVPYFNPAIKVGSDGVARVRVKLPDNLTQFKLRAKAVSGEERFGFAKSQVAVRLPVIVQPSLPRFVRPGDSFVATAIGRIVEGGGGPGRAQARVSGLQLESEATQDFEWRAERPQRIDFKLRVPDPGYDEQGRPSYEEVVFTGAVERSADQARDAFEVKLPVRADRRPVVERVIAEVTPAEGLSLPAVTQAVRPGTLKRSLLLSDQPGLIRMAGGLNYLLEYPHGCTEQRLSRARAYLALDRFRGLLYDDRSDEALKQSVNQTLEWIESVVDADGLAGYWPGSPGYVSLTAWVVQFMVEARNAGYPVNETLFDRMTAALGQALRSDYRRFIVGEAYSERSMALWALAVSGKLDKAYAAELARKADYLNLEAVARVVRVLRKLGAGESAMGEKLSQRLWNGLVFRLYQGNEIYGGLQQNAVSGNRLILPSETRTLAEIVRTLEVDSGDKARLQTLVDGLVTLGAGDGWGSTNATSAALLALSDFMLPGAALDTEQQLQVELDGSRQQLTLGGEKRLLKLHGAKGDPVEVRSLRDTTGRPLVVRAETRYLPAGDGSRVEPRSKGFVVNRELLQVQGEGEPPRRIPLTQGAQQIELRVGDVIEDQVALVNAEERTFVAVVVPLAAGMEPLNPHLATAPVEAKPANSLTREPSYTAYLDDRVAFYYDSLPRGNYHFYFRTRATIQGEFIQPAAYAELMYEEAVSGNSAGARVVIQAKAGE